MEDSTKVFVVYRYQTWLFHLMETWTNSGRFSMSVWNSFIVLFNVGMSALKGLCLMLPRFSGSMAH